MGIGHFPPLSLRSGTQSLLVAQESALVRVDLPGRNTWTAEGASPETELGVLGGAAHLLQASPGWLTVAPPLLIWPQEKNLGSAVK